MAPPQRRCRQLIHDRQGGEVVLVVPFDSGFEVSLFRHPEIAEFLLCRLENEP